MKRIIPVITILLVLIAAGLWYGFSVRETFPPVGNSCYDHAMELVDAARERDLIFVPAFEPSDIASMRCASTRGFIQFEIAGIDSAVKDFHIYQISGGMAASGADTISDYCYTSNGEFKSGARITGRDGKISQPSCRYDESLIPEPSDTYVYEQD